MNKISKIILLLAIITAIVTRFWNVSSLPYPPDGDEVAFGYYGWSLLHFGTDEYTKTLPTSFSSIGDNKYPGLGYLNIIPAAIFGLSNITIRFWSAISGVILVWLVYLLTLYLFKNKSASLFAAWATALSPWSIILSRLGYESLPATTVTTAGVVCLFYSERFKSLRTRKLLIIGSFLLLIVAFFTYAAARFFIPTFLLAIFAISYLKDSGLKNLRKILFAFIAVFIAIGLISAASPKNWGRAKDDLWKGITDIENNRLQELYVQAGTSKIKLPARLTWLMHNKYRISLFDLIDRYSKHFSISYLITNGEDIGQKIPDMGVLLFCDLFLIPLGLISLIKKDYGRTSLILLFWLILSPIPSALTHSDSKMMRASLLIVPFSILSGLGFGYITTLAKNKVIKIEIVIIMALFLSSVYSLNQIFVQKPLDKPWTNQTFNEKLTKKVLTLKDKYQAVATSGDDYIFYLFYGRISPKDFINRSSISNDNWNKVTRLDNIFFNMPFKCPKGGKLNVLYVCTGGEIPQNSKIVEAFYYPDGVPAATLIEFYPVSKMPKHENLPPPPDMFHYMVSIEDKYYDGIIPKDSKSLW